MKLFEPKNIPKLRIGNYLADLIPTKSQVRLQKICSQFSHLTFLQQLFLRIIFQPRKSELQLLDLKH